MTRQITAAAFSVVVLVAAVISYDHIRLTAGPHWWAFFIPLSVDGLMVAGSMVLWLERREGKRGTPLAWAAVLAGLVVSLLANGAQADPGATGLLMALWPSLALAVGFELLIRVNRAAEKPEARSFTATRPARRTVADVIEPISPEVDEAAETPSRVRQVGSSRSAQVRAWIAAELDAGREPSGAEADAHFGLTGKARCGARALKTVLDAREQVS